jgi:hypothetical protein
MISGEFNAAPMDTLARVLTAVVIVMAGAFPFIPNMPVYGALVMPLIILVTWLFAVRGYAIEDGVLKIQRPFWTTTISLPPDTVFRAEPEIRKGLWRTAGNGGLFGYTGWYRNSSLGSFRAYVTSWSNAVSITSESTGLRIVLSPESQGIILLDTVS